MTKEDKQDLMTILTGRHYQLNLKEYFILIFWELFNQTKLEQFYKQLKTGKTIRASFGTIKRIR